jgi:hypothetical protein
MTLLGRAIPKGPKPRWQARVGMYPDQSVEGPFSVGKPPGQLYRTQDLLGSLEA